MPVTIAKRFIVDFPFGAGPVGRYKLLEERKAVSRCAENGEIGKLRAKLAVVDWMQRKFYLLQQILFSFCELPGFRAEPRSPFPRGSA
jgi:hypothetical protein